MKIAVYAICKNEEKFVDGWVDSMSEADAIYVSDTGSTDGTVERLRSRGVNVNVIHVSPWRFDQARNISMAQVPLDVDVCVCTDLDEILEPGWRAKLETAWVEGVTTRAKYMYTWSFKPDGSRGTTFWYDKVHARGGYRWTLPVHEVLSCAGPESFAWVPDMQLNHYPDWTKSRGSYLPLLEMSVAESPDNDRNMHYLGREYMFHAQYGKAIETLRRHLALPSATWADERAASMRFIARSHRALGDLVQTEVWYMRAIGEAPHLREAYAELAKFKFENEKWDECLYWAKQAFKITDKPDTYINEAFAWDETLPDMASFSAWQIGDQEAAGRYARSALELAPDNERLRKNMEFFG